MSTIEHSSGVDRRLALHPGRTSPLLTEAVTHIEQRGFFTPTLDLDELIWPRVASPVRRSTYRSPRSSTSSCELGSRLDPSDNEHMAQALEASIAVNPLGPRILEAAYRSLGGVFERAVARLPGRPGSGPRPARRLGRGDDPTGTHPTGARLSAASHPRPRRQHAGRHCDHHRASALTKGVHLLKLPSNDLFTATAMLRTLEEIAPDHPVTKSFSCVYWRGGDASVEGVLFRAQFFDKLVAWGGDAAIRSALHVHRAGLRARVVRSQGVDLDGRRGSARVAETIADSARRAAIDVALFNQSACASSRFVFIEAEPGDELDAWCSAPRRRARRRPTDVGRRTASRPHRRPRGSRTAARPRRQYKVWGTYEDGVVIRSDGPGRLPPRGQDGQRGPDRLARRCAPARERGHADDRHLSRRRVGSTLRDMLAARGMQRIVPLGEVLDAMPGLPHDGFYPLHRFVRWLVDDC